MQQGALCRGHSGEGQGHTTPVLATRETRGCRMRAAAGHMQPGRPGLDAGTEAGGALTAPGRLLAWGRQQGWQSAGVLCTRGTLQGEPYTGRSAVCTRGAPAGRALHGAQRGEDTGRQQAARETLAGDSTAACAAQARALPKRHSRPESSGDTLPPAALCGAELAGQACGRRSRPAQGLSLGGAR